MPGGVAIFDYNRDGRPDIFFANGANIATLKKDSPKYPQSTFPERRQRRVHRCHGSRRSRRAPATISGPRSGTIDNDGWPDLFVAGVHRNTLYHNNGDGTFTDVTAKAGLDHCE